MRILAIEASTEWCSVAVGDAHTLVMHEERAGQTHSQRILPMARAVLATMEWSFAELDGIVYGAGPGSFTGVRIACGIAQGLGFGLDRPLLGVSTLEAIAQEALRAHGWATVMACVDARMREVYLGAYRREGGRWRAAVEPMVLSPAAVLLPDMLLPWSGAGNGFAAYPFVATDHRFAGVDADLRPTARAMLELAMPRLLAGEGVAAAKALPLYIRHRVALTMAERAAGARL